ncbi:hypothetical protein AGDE_11025 [Angomonas deanei]|uniref:Uncharacterized protein n=1 Tax=Angomonas deanei TaxID=59799 RepID=A0A7G2CT72_9TRYP|nr:hypothetical protein AGDE_11025 [Angomonas deanei]CAD2221422.1 hypothetical protein, conserved [Angomonas deanei]|eukprot:EPY26921.1 hypothetical protein AGDE_11025 [Angomonas deanei]
MQERKQKSRPDPLNFPGEEKVEVGETQYGTFTESRGEGDKTAEKDLTLWQYMTSPSSPLRVHIQEHCQHQWVAVVVSILLFLIILYIVSFSQNPQRPDFCTTNFGTYLGESRGISAYSNCNHDYNSNVMPHYISIGLQKHFTGNKWHSVEYVRRFWMVTRWISLPVVNLPYKFSTITSATNVNSPNRNSSSVKIQHYANLPLSTYLKGVPSVPVGGGVNENNVPMKEWVLNKDLAMIQEGDILIYPKNKKDTAPRPRGGGRWCDGAV